MTAPGSILLSSNEASTYHRAAEFNLQDEHANMLTTMSRSTLPLEQPVLRAVFEVKAVERAVILPRDQDSEAVDRLTALRLV